MKTLVIGLFLVQLAFALQLANAQVLPQDAVQALFQEVQSANIPRKQKLPLLAILKTGEAAFERDRVEVGIKRLQIFQRKVTHSRQIQPGIAQRLIDLAQEIIDSIQDPAEFDLANDFSLESNPSGAWTYGYQVSLSSPFIPFTFSKYNYDQNGVPVEVWSINSYETPAIQRNATSSTVITDYGAGIYPPGTVWYYPGPGAHEGDPSYSEAIRKEANYGVVRFTLPSDAAGTYHLVAEVKSAYIGWTFGDTDFHILKNGQEIYGQFLPAAGAASFEDEVSLDPGDTIDFVIGRGLDDSYHGSGLIIEAALKQVP